MGSPISAPYTGHTYPSYAPKDKQSQLREYYNETSCKGCGAPLAPNTTQCPYCTRKTEQ